MFHFYTFPGAVSGGDNYSKLVAAVVLASKANSTDATIRAQAVAARGQVSAFVQATRTGLDNLSALSQVSELRHILGSAGSGLAAGWAMQLLQTGKTGVGTVDLDLVLGNWSNAQYIPVSDHNDHVHVTLSRPALGE
jgi:hypothetical protein